MSQELDLSRPNFYLFGYPISHSASPAFQNFLFKEQGLPEHRYQLHDTKALDDPDSQFLELIRSKSIGGAAVTMPLKVLATSKVDELSEEVRSIGSINTIVVKSIASDGRPVLLGKNTDYEGVRNAILLHLPESRRNGGRSYEGRWGFIIGGGGTTRAAVYALTESMGCERVYLINRDENETAEIIAHFPHLDLQALTSLEQWTSECEEKVAVGVGAIPSFEPVTDGEKNVYAVARKVFASKNAQKEERLFLEMCYKPRRTIMIGIAESAGWQCIGGIEAMIEQGLAQQRAWLLHSAASPWKSSRSELGANIEDRARSMVRAMSDL